MSERKRLSFQEVQALTNFEALVYLRDNFSDEVPDTILHGVGNYKVRRNWCGGVIGYLSNMLESGMFEEPLITDIRVFIEFYTSEIFYDQELTTSEDIRRANELLNRVIALQNR